METAKSALSKKCKEDIIKALKEYKNISKINIIPVLDKSDKKNISKRVSLKKRFSRITFKQPIYKQDFSNCLVYARTTKR